MVRRTKNLIKFCEITTASFICRFPLSYSIIGESITGNKGQLYALPSRSGGLDIPIFSEKAENDFDNFIYITAPLVALIVMQEETLLITKS